MRETQSKQAQSIEPLFGALDQIGERGSLLWFLPDRTQRLGMMNALGKQGLVAWNQALGRYELTEAGRQCLDGYRRLAEKHARAAGA
jgi:hypothetical protein